jgi:TetR/AcrR family transcriptional regulator, transcriptional repressor of bet genes
VPDPLPEASPRPPRTMSRAARRAQLIEATIETLAARGYARLTLTDVARTAGLSHGLVLFHFQTKERLLAETLSFLAEEYRANWQSALAQVGKAPADQLNALIQADFAPAICTPSRLAAWCSFWGEAQSRPLYQAACGDKDRAYNAQLEDICQRLSDLGGYGHDAVRIARVIRVTIEGTWLDLMSGTPPPYDKDEALRTVRTCVAQCFPRHFDLTGVTPGR